MRCAARHRRGRVTCRFELEHIIDKQFRRVAGAADARADFMLTSTSDGSFRRVFDVTVSAPRTTLSAVQRGKASHYSANHHIHDVKQIVPFGIEVSGPSAEEIVKCLTQRGKGAVRGIRVQRIQYASVNGCRSRCSVATRGWCGSGRTGRSDWGGWTCNPGAGEQGAGEQGAGEQGAGEQCVRDRQQQRWPEERRRQRQRPEGPRLPAEG